MTPTVDQIRAAVAARADKIVGMLLDSVRIESNTGNEGAAMAHIRSLMDELGLDVDEFETSADEMAPYIEHIGEQSTYANRPSLVGKRAGSGGGKSLMIAGHIDTVPVEDPTKWQHNPLGEIEGDRLYGRGATDMKNGVIAGIAVPMIIADLGVTLAGDLLVNATTGEEDGGLGAMSTIARGYRPDGVINTEPSEHAVVVASEGSLNFRITINGKSAHAANKPLGVSAVEKFIPIFQDLMAWEEERNRSLDHPLYNHMANKVPINVGVVRAGLWGSSVPDTLTAEVRLGFLPGEDMHDMMRQTEERIRDTAVKDDWLREHPPTIEYLGGQFVAAEIAPDHPLANAVGDACEAVLGRRTAVLGMPGGADTRLWTTLADVPALMYGPGILDMAHQNDEYVEISALLDGVAVLVETTIRWCGLAGEPAA